MAALDVDVASLKKMTSQNSTTTAAADSKSGKRGEKMTIATYVLSMEFHLFVNFLHSLQRLDHKGKHYVNPESVRIAVYDLGGGTVMDYHSYLLRAAAYGKGRGRPQFELHVKDFPTQVRLQ
eukprot:scaffold547_cov384-Prasinococcus_capsulatus_cf.AAC.8